MAYRDRTALFLRYRAEARALHSRRHTGLDVDEGDEDSTRLLSRGGPSGDVTAAHAELKEDVRSARALLRELRDGYAAHLLPRFDGDNSTAALEADVREKAHALTSRLHAAQGRVRSLGADTPVQKNLQRRFAGELQEISREARARQKDWLDQLQRQRDTLGEESPRIVDSFSLDEDEVMQVQLSNEEHDQAEARRREVELTAVASSISELATLVKDLASLVVDQGTLLDRIDYNLEETKDITHKAVRQLRIADGYHRKRQAFCVIVLLAIACGVLMIILVYRWTT